LTLLEIPLSEPWPVESMASFLTEGPRNGVSPSDGGTVRGAVLTLSAITGAVFDESAIKEADFKANPPASKRVDHRDFLVCRGNGNPRLVGLGFFPGRDLPGVIFPDTMIALRVDNSRIDRKYLEFVWRSKRVRAQIEAGARTTNGTFKINQKVVEGIQIPVPPIEEQRRLAVMLDLADELRVKRRQSITLLEGLAKSIFLDIFGDPSANPKNWPTGNLGEIITDGPQNGLYKPASEYGSGVRIVRIDSFRDGVIPDLSTLKHLKVSGDELARWALRPGDLLINRVNSLEHLGKSALVPTLTEPTVYESNMMRFAVDGNILNPQFLIQVLQSADIKRQILSRAKNAVNQSSINQGDVRALRIILPPLRLQHEFLGEIKAADHIIRGAREQLRKFDELFASLQAKAFRGEL
jgi:type I restriction enzyme, S subunit